jgi:hypothetical protein
MRNKNKLNPYTSSGWRTTLVSYFLSLLRIREEERKIDPGQEYRQSEGLN